MRLIFAAILAASAVMPADRALAFGTTHLLGQNAEHERITRHALGCGEPGGPNARDCFKANSLSALAGEVGFGAVGAPDNPVNFKIFDAKSHCDDGDHLDVPGYPQSAAAARGALVACRAYMIAKLNEAVNDAGALVVNGQLVDSEVPGLIGCLFNYGKGRAYCNAIEDFGVALHAVQDFYAHSNWTDAADTAKPIAIDNPPGLGHRGRAPWLDPRQEIAFPSGLMTGCFLGDLPKGVSGCPGRVTHFYLNKDDSDIDPRLGAGTTPRGKVDQNFAHAAEAAIEDTRDKWSYLRDRLLNRYGARNGALIICALTTRADYERYCR
jgi:hypothetical protein